MKSRDFRELEVGSKKVEADFYRRAALTKFITEAIDKAGEELSRVQFQIMLDELASDIVSRQAFTDFEEGDDD